MLEAVMHELGDLSDDELLERLRKHIGKGHIWQAGLIAYLVEVEDRRLDRVLAYSSLWDFCTRKLGMSESEAQRRIAAARVVRRFPHVLGFIERGEIGLCALYALRRHLTTENVDDLLREAAGKSTRAVEEMVAARFPKPDVPPSALPVAPPSSAGAQPAWSLSLGMPAPEPRPKVEPLSATRYRIEVTVSAETKANLERIRDLMRHRNPTGDLETILDASLGLLLAKLEKERLGKTSRRRRDDTTERKAAGALSDAVRAESESREPNAPVRSGTATQGPDAPADANVRSEDAAAPEQANTADRPARPTKTIRAGYVSRAVRREVFARDGEQCTYVDADGHRCLARGFLELDHIHTRAHGGEDTADNVRVRCRAHNALYAEQVFGRAHVERRIHLQRRKCARPESAPFDTLAQALRSLGFREPEVRKALAILQTKLDTESTPIETLLREALLVLT